MIFNFSPIHISTAGNRAPGRRAAALACVFLMAVAALGTASAQEQNEGVRLFLKGDYEKAVERLDNSRPTVETLVYLSLAHQELGQYTDARSVVTRTRSWERYLPLVNRLGELELELANYTQARRRFRQALAQDSTYLESRLHLGEMEMAWGNVSEANRLLGYFIDLYKKTPYPDARLSYLTARACIQLNRFEDANDLFHDASKYNADDWRIYVDWGRLFLDKYSFSDALATFRDALKRNPNATAAKLGIARVGEQDQQQDAPAILDLLLKEQADRLDVRLYAAHLYSITGDRKKAKKNAEKALQIAPNHLEALSLLAQVALLDKNQAAFASMERKALDVNPKYSRFYTDAGNLLSRRYLFEEAIALYKKALALNPVDAMAHAGLGTALSRLAKLDQAKPALEEAFRLDPYNVWTGNLLSLFDSYKSYVNIRTEHFLIRLHKDDAEIVGPYAAALAEQAFAEMAPRYEFKPDGPITIEIFPKHDDFAVRCFGLPGAEAFLGICFGPLITMNSPRARPVGTFNWQETLWHEFAHVVHLGLTKNRIPRWLAEGIAVYEATSARAAWDMNLQLSLIRAVQEDGLIPLSELNSGFVGDPGRVTYSYYQSSQMVAYIVEEHGFKALTKLLAAFREDAETADAVRDVLGLSEKAFDKAFETYVRRRFRVDKVEFGWPEHKGKGKGDGESIMEKMQKFAGAEPSSFFGRLRQGTSLLAEEEFAEAIPVFEKAKKQYADYYAEGNAYAGLARAYVETGDTARAIENLKILIGRNSKSFRASVQLHELASAYGDAEADLAALEAAVQISPYNAKLHRNLGDHYLANGDPLRAAQEFEVELALKTVDRAGAHCRLAEALLRTDQPDEAKRHALLALEIAPTYERAQKVLMQVVAQ